MGELKGHLTDHRGDTDDLMLTVSLGCVWH